MCKCACFKVTLNIRNFNFLGMYMHFNLNECRAQTMLMTQLPVFYMLSLFKVCNSTTQSNIWMFYHSTDLFESNQRINEFTSSLCPKRFKMELGSKDYVIDLIEFSYLSGCLIFSYSLLKYYSTQIKCCTSLLYLFLIHNYILKRFYFKNRKSTPVILSYTSNISY